MAPVTADVLVIGAGAVGASSAFHLARAGLSVLVADRFDGPAEGSTGRCFASVRGQWADDLNIELSWRSIRSLREFAAEHGIDVGYAATGYLFLVPDAAWPAQLDAVERQRRHGVPVEVLDLEAASRLTPFDAAGLAGATWGPADGVADPHGLTTAYLDLARRRGARTAYRRPVTSVRRTGGAWTVVAGADTVSAGTVVNAAGGWAGEVAAQAGLDVPVRHSRRNVYAGAPGTPAAPARQLPMTIDLATGVYLRSEGDRVLFGGPPSPRATGPAGSAGSAGYATDVDWPWMESVLELGVPRFPWLGDLPLDRSAAWAGTYEMSPDSQGILGPNPAAEGWYDACGFSGHGFMQSPEIGRLVAEEITTGRIASIAADPAPLRIGRFAEPAAGRAPGDRRAVALVI
jgi:sarcosine oxidase subunit beta